MTAAASEEAPATPLHPALVLTVSVLAISSAALWVLAADEAPSLTTAFWRVTISAALLGGAVLAQRRAITVPWRYALPGGIALGLHFWLWMESLRWTSVASSTLFVTTAPFWVALYAAAFDPSDRLGRHGWTGIATAVAGGALIASAGFGDNGKAGSVDIFGLGLAWLAAVLAAAYFLWGARVRRTLDTVPAAAIMNAVAAATLAVALAVTKTAPTGFALGTWGAFLALALIPQMIGHNGLLWAMRFLGPTVASVAVLLEPVGAAVLAWVLLGQVPVWQEGVGGLLLLCGLALVITGRSRPKTEEV